METNAWDSYRYQSLNDVVEGLVWEQIALLSRYGKAPQFRCVVEKRRNATYVYGLLILLSGLLYALRESVPTGLVTTVLVLVLSVIICRKVFRAEKFSFGVVVGCLALSLFIYMPVMMYVQMCTQAGNGLVILLLVIWILRMCMITQKRAAKYLVKQVSKNPTEEISRIVARDVLDPENGTRLTDTKWFPVLVVAAALLPILAIPAIQQANQIHQDGMIFEPYGDGCILIDCEKDFDKTMVFIPNQVEGLTVVAIDSGAFMDETTIQTVNIPKTVTSIGAEAFSGCTKLESITIPASVTEIRGNCFENCRSLKVVNLHDGITSIHGYAFRGCSALEQITLPAHITEIRGYCFENCTSLRSIVIPEGVIRIAAHAFMGCSSLESVSVPSTVTEIGSSAFRECDSLLEITIPQGATVDERSFKDSPTNVTRK